MQASSVEKADSIYHVSSGIAVPRIGCKILIDWWIWFDFFFCRYYHYCHLTWDSKLDGEIRDDNS